MTPDVKNGHLNDAPRLSGAVRRMLRALVRRAGAGELEAVEQLRLLAIEATEYYSAGIYAAHTGAGAYSYGKIAAELGSSRQAIRQTVERAAVRDGR
jgi:hypothetical protein